MAQVAWRYAEIEPDFIVGAAAAALYISVQYHLLHPAYLKSRLVSLDGKFRVRILLVHVVRRYSYTPSEPNLDAAMICGRAIHMLGVGR